MPKHHIRLCHTIFQIFQLTFFPQITFKRRLSNQDCVQKLVKFFGPLEKIYNTSLKIYTA